MFGSGGEGCGEVGLFAAESGEHAGVVRDRGDGGTDAFPEWFTARCPSKIVVTARAGRLGHDLEPLRIGAQRDQRLGRDSVTTAAGLPSDGGR